MAFPALNGPLGLVLFWSFGTNAFCLLSFRMMVHIFELLGLN